MWPEAADRVGGGRTGLYVCRMRRGAHRDLARGVELHALHWWLPSHGRKERPEFLHGVSACQRCVGAIGHRSSCAIFSDIELNCLGFNCLLGHRNTCSGSVKWTMLALTLKENKYTENEIVGRRILFAFLTAEN